MTVAILVLTVLNSAGIGALLYKSYGVTVPTKVEAPAEDQVTLSSDTEGLA